MRPRARRSSGDASARRSRRAACPLSSCNAWSIVSSITSAGAARVGSVIYVAPCVRSTPGLLGSPSAQKTHLSDLPGLRFQLHRDSLTQFFYFILLPNQPPPPFCLLPLATQAHPQVPPHTPPAAMRPCRSHGRAPSVHL